MEATLNASIRRVGTVALAALVIATATDSVPATPATPAPTDTTVTDLLDLRARPAAAARATSAPRAAAPARKHRLSAAQSRVVANNRRRAAVVRFAKAQKGKWYRYGATGLRNYDCSGLTKRSMRQAGITLPRTSGAQRRAGIRVSAANARTGDLVSYRGHVGILVGRWTMADAPGRGRRVAVRKIYRTGDLQFRRIIR